ncbi:MAG: hypothetical protein V4581_06235 [Bacteroidota bacterium]
MDITSILNSMKAYNLILGNSALLVDKFKQGSYFYFDLPSYASTSSNIHAYPGIHEGKLKFFLIPSNYDAHGVPHIESYVTVCAVERNLEGNRIPDREAAALVSCWDSNYETWIPDEVTNSPYGMFQAFSIPMGDFEVTNTRVNLALKPSATAVSSFQADIVVTNDAGSDVYYDDYATSVPPFSPSALSASFYLLSLV